jgi:hypothetical protein
LHNVRHDNLIHLSSSLNSEEVNIIPGSLPLLVEEIIKSNIISTSRPLQIVLAREDNHIRLPVASGLLRHS